MKLLTFQTAKNLNSRQCFYLTIKSDILISHDSILNCFYVFSSCLLITLIKCLKGLCDCSLMSTSKTPCSQSGSDRGRYRAVSDTDWTAKKTNQTNFGPRKECARFCQKTILIITMSSSSGFYWCGFLRLIIVKDKPR